MADTMVDPSVFHWAASKVVHLEHQKADKTGYLKAD